MDRRTFILSTAGTILGLASGNLAEAKTGKSGNGSMYTQVSIVKGRNRPYAIEKAIDLLGVNPVAGREVLIKPNFNTADPFPASTHNETLSELIRKLKDMGAAALTVGERCGPPDTADVIREKGVNSICRKHGVGLINFEELPENQWQRIRPAKSHWKDGFDVARPVLDAECIVSTCCLKTHRYGGVFTMSLKLSVGITHKRNMGELHGSPGDMRMMIAEINQAYSPSLILMDGMKVFTDGGPMSGEMKRADVMVAGTDRVAVDSVGLAILKEMGANRQIMQTSIFEQEQIRRGAELGLGVNSPDKIKLLTDDPVSDEYALKLQEILLQG